MAAFIIAGLCGFIGMSFIFPLIEYVLILCCGGSRKQNRAPDAHPLSVAIIIPAHNEELLIGHTLKRIQRCILSTNRALYGDIHIIVGADGCTDGTAKIARRWGAEVVEAPSNIKKWAMIGKLAERCEQSDWVILADAGVSWQEDLLNRLHASLSNPLNVGAAPSYRNNNDGLLEKIHWSIERLFKSLESMCGGPVSVHGATACYRTQHLKKALRFLAGENWLNDDVVIPVVLRSLFPEMKIEYLPSVPVSEIQGTPSPSPEYRRRRRMILGNIQWTSRLWLFLWRRNRNAAVLAMRRIFRILWAYWVLLLLIGIVGTLGSLWAVPQSGIIAVTLLMTLLLVLSPGRFAAGFLASVMTPYYFLESLLSTNVSEAYQWK